MAAAHKGLDTKLMNKNMISEGLEKSRQPDRTGLGFRHCWDCVLSA